MTPRRYGVGLARPAALSRPATVGRVGAVGAVQKASFRALLPECVEVSECYHDGDPEALYVEEREYLARVVPKRRAEFATTRRCVREALSRLGLERPPMIPGAGGAPVWPSGVVGSITHCSGYRAAAVALGSMIRAVGIDAEPAEPLPTEVIDLVVGSKEIKALQRLSEQNPDVPWECLLFSIKEAVYKVWFPLSRTWLDFKDARVTIDAAGTFTAVLSETVDSLDRSPLRKVEGKWACDQRHVLSAAVVFASEPGG